MRRDFWEVIGMALIIELFLRIIHAVAPIATAGYLPITGDDIKQTGIVLMAAVVGYGIYRYFRLPPDDPDNYDSYDGPRPDRMMRRKAGLPILAPKDNPPLLADPDNESPVIDLGPAPQFLLSKKAADVPNTASE